MEYKSFFKVFSKCPREGEHGETLAGARVIKTLVNKQSRSLRVSLLFERYISDAAAQAVCERIRKSYDLSEVNLRVCCHNADAREHIEDFFKEARQDIPVLKGFFGGEYSLDEDALTLFVSFSGSGLLHNMGCESSLEELFFQKFGRRIKVALSDRIEERLSYEQFEEKMSVGVERAPAPPQGGDEVPAAPQALFGRLIKSEPVEISSVTALMGRATICGVMDAPSRKALQDGSAIVSFNVEDMTGIMAVSVFVKEGAVFADSGLKAGDTLLVRGSVRGDGAMRASAVTRVYVPKRADGAPQKRVELHAHTTHSYMDGTASVTDLVERAALWGHKAIAITDHACVAGIIEGCKAGEKCGVKVICGMEGYYVNDNETAVYGEEEAPFSGSFTVFDIETTGLSAYSDRITEIGAVRVENGKVTDSFSQLVDPGIPIPARITELTGITDGMVAGCPDIGSVLPDFLRFAQGSVLVAHNANFDCGFLMAGAKRLGTVFNFTYIDTVPLCRSVFPELGSVKLDTVAAHIGLGKFNHHRACDDAQVLSKIFLTLLSRFGSEKGLDQISKLNDNLSANLSALRRYHITILVKNQQGLSDLYRIISKSNTDFNFRRPIIPKSLLMRLRKNLLIGSACNEGELFELISEGRSYSEIYKCASFYDFYELQPLCNNMSLVDSGKIADTEALRRVYREIIKLGVKFNRPVAATGDIHFLDEGDMEARAVLCSAKNIRDERTQGPLYFKTTDEMLDEFSWLGEEMAQALVIKNTIALADKCHRITPLPEAAQLPAFTAPSPATAQYPPASASFFEASQSLTVSVPAEASQFSAATRQPDAPQAKSAQAPAFTLPAVLSELPTPSPQFPELAPPTESAHLVEPTSPLKAPQSPESVPPLEAVPLAGSAPSPGTSQSPESAPSLEASQSPESAPSPGTLQSSEPTPPPEADHLAESAFPPVAAHLAEPTPPPGTSQSPEPTPPPVAAHLAESAFPPVAAHLAESAPSPGTSQSPESAPSSEAAHPAEPTPPHGTSHPMQVTSQPDISKDAASALKIKTPPSLGTTSQSFTLILKPEIERFPPSALPSESGLPGVSGSSQADSAQPDGGMAAMRALVLRGAEVKYGKEIPAAISNRIEDELKYIGKNGLLAVFMAARRILDGIAGEFPAAVTGMMAKFFCAYFSGIADILPELKERFDLEKALPSDSQAASPHGDGDRTGMLDIELSLPDKFRQRMPEIVSDIFGDGHCVFMGRSVTISPAAAKSIVRNYEEGSNTAFNEAAAQRIAQKITGARRTMRADTDKMYIIPAQITPSHVMPLSVQSAGGGKRLHTHFDGDVYDGIFLRLTLSDDRGGRILRMLEQLTGVKAADMGDDEAAASLSVSCRAMGIEDELLPNGLAGIDGEGVGDSVKYRLLWYKLRFPQEFYCAFFSAADSPDMGAQWLLANQHSIKRSIKAAGADADKEMIERQTVALEMLLRGLSFRGASLASSDSVCFLPYGEKEVLLPLASVEGLSAADADALVRARQSGDYFSAQALIAQSGISKTSAQILEQTGLILEMDEAAQPKLF